MSRRLKGTVGEVQHLPSFTKPYRYLCLDRAAISGEDQFTHLRTRKTDLAVGAGAIVAQVATANENV
jgi:hypothetical protein